MLKWLVQLLERRRVPAEYFPWVADLTPFVSKSLAPVNRRRLNADENGMARMLLGLYVAGVVAYYKDARGLTYGQQRFLTIEVLHDAGWPYDAASFIFDFSTNPSEHLTQHVSEANDAIDAGRRAARAHFEDADFRAGMMPEIKLMQWQRTGLWVP